MTISIPRGILCKSTQPLHSVAVAVAVSASSPACFPAMTATHFSLRACSWRVKSPFPLEGRDVKGAESTDCLSRLRGSLAVRLQGGN